jgi:ribulose-5-phosphate 4-epimerase/fuculose-1-phosphate aldolase
MIACGETIEEVWSYAFHLALACETQLRALSLGIDNLILSPEDASEQVRTHLY